MCHYMSVLSRGAGLRGWGGAPGIGIAIKAANLQRFQATFPGNRLVHSWNAEENGPMVRINDALGFRPVEHLAEMQRARILAP